MQSRADDALEFLQTIGILGHERGHLGVGLGSHRRPEFFGPSGVGRARMFGVVNGQLRGRHRHKRPFGNRLGLAELQVLVEPVVHDLAADLVVVVVELHEGPG